MVRNGVSLGVCETVTPALLGFVRLLAMTELTATSSIATHAALPGTLKLLVTANFPKGASRNHSVMGAWMGKMWKRRRRG